MLQSLFKRKREQNKAKKEERAQLKAKRAEEKKRTKNQERLQHEQVKDVSDLPEVGQTNDIPIYGHNEQEDQVNSQPNKRKNESLTMKLKAAKQHQIHKKIIIKRCFDEFRTGNQ